MAYTLNDYLKQKATGTPVPSFGFPSSTALPVAPKLPAPSFSVATVPPVMPAIATWDDVKHAALPVAPTLPRLPDSSLPLAPKLPNLAETTPRFSTSPTFDYVTRTSAPPQPEKPSFWERSSAFANAPSAPSIWDRASKLNQPVAPVQTTAQPQFGSRSDARASGAAGVNPFAAPSFTGAPVTPTTNVNLPGTAATAWGSAPAIPATPRYTPRLPEHSFASFAPAAPSNAATAFARQPSSAQATTAATAPTTTTSLTGRYTPLGNDTPFAAVAEGAPNPLGAGSNSVSRSTGLSSASQSILADIDRIKRDNNIGNFDRLGIRLNSLSEGVAAGLDDNIAQARLERYVEDAVAEGEMLPLVENAAGVGSLFDPRRSQLNSPQDGLPQYTMVTAEEAALYRAAEAAGLGVDGWWANGAEPSSPSQPDGLPSPFPQGLYERLRAAAEARSDIFGTLEAGLDRPFTERDLEAMSSLEYYRPPNSNVSWFVDQYGRFPSSMQEAWERRVMVDEDGYNEYIEGLYAAPMDLGFQAEGPTLTGNFPDHLYDSRGERALEGWLQTVGAGIAGAVGGMVDLATFIMNKPVEFLNWAFDANFTTIEDPAFGSEFIRREIINPILTWAGVTLRDPDTEMTPAERHLYQMGAYLIGGLLTPHLPPSPPPESDDSWYRRD